METAYFAGGCFWCITPTFKELAGVAEVVSGYSGGDEANPAYADVKHQRTGHRETIRIDYDPQQVAFSGFWTYFWIALTLSTAGDSLSTGAIPTPWRCIT